MKVTEDWEKGAKRTTVGGVAKYLCQKLADKLGLNGSSSPSQTQAWPESNGAGNWPADNSNDDSFLVSVDESDTINKIIIH